MTRNHTNSLFDAATAYRITAPSASYARTFFITICRIYQEFFSSTPTIAVTPGKARKKVSSFM